MSQNEFSKMINAWRKKSKAGTFRDTLFLPVNESQSLLNCTKSCVENHVSEAAGG